MLTLLNLALFKDTSVMGLAKILLFVVKGKYLTALFRVFRCFLPKYLDLKTSSKLSSKKHLIYLSETDLNIDNFIIS